MKNGLDLLRSQAALFEGSDVPLGMDEYQQFTRQTAQDQRPGIEGLSFTLLGLFGETGSLLSELKKKQRDRDAYVGYHDSVLEELGDCLWYFANTALRAGLDLSLVAHRAMERLDGWTYHGRAGARTFVALQKPKAELVGPGTGPEFERRLIALAGKVGHLLEDFSVGRIDANGDAFSADLVDIFRALVAAADDAQVSLDEAAQRNIAKALDRWPLRRAWSPSFDEDFDQDERLPRRIIMSFREKDINGKKYVIQRCNGINIGDRLTDNRVEPDDYRFHDVFHLAYAAILGWSPVIRALFRVKRKSKPLVDENQDGARAILIEEGVSTWIFNHAARLHDFRNVKSLDYGLLKAIRQLVEGYEVEERPLWQWELAIPEGFRIFREMRVYRAGTVTADLDAHTITFEVAE
jgi:NTP pyrophosphatase (non-canonical NTP hydrolase)